MPFLPLAKFSWSQFVQSNRVFWIAFSLFFLCAIGLVLGFPKGFLVLWFGAHRTPLMNTLFSLLTQGGEVAGFLIAGFSLWLVRSRWIIALGALTLAVTLTANGTKSLFHQPRPARYFQDLGMQDRLHQIPGVSLHSGFTSLPSGHTMAAFAFFSLVAFATPKKSWTALACLLAASLVGISRIYLSQHFEEDVLLGSVLGTLLAAVFYRLFLTWSDSNRASQR